MSVTVSGWCSPGPPGSRPQHERCRMSPSCGCFCHRGGAQVGSKQGDSASEVGLVRGSVCDNSHATLPANKVARATAAKRSPGLTITPAKDVTA